MLLLNNSTVEVINPNKYFTLLYVEKLLKVWMSRLREIDSFGKIGCDYMGQLDNCHVLKVSIETSNKKIGPLFSYLDMEYKSNYREGKYQFEYLTGISRAKETKKTVISINQETPSP